MAAGRTSLAMIIDHHLIYLYIRLGHTFAAHKRWEGFACHCRRQDAPSGPVSKVLRRLHVHGLIKDLRYVRDLMITSKVETL